MRKHTPGPWFAASEGSYKVASVTSNTGIYADTLPEAAQIAADARLIAAAPDLLEALKDIHARLTEHPAYAELTEDEEEDIGGDTAELSYLARMARTAIAKAEGA
jgi:hypothetical protein